MTNFILKEYSKAFEMHSAFVIPPHPALDEFIYSYSLTKSERRIKALALPWVAHHDTSLCFFLADRPKQKAIHKQNHLKGYANRITLYGLLTESIGEMSFEGNYSTFIIEFKPNGFARLFNIPATEISEGVFAAEEIVGNSIQSLYNNLANARNLREMMAFADDFLITILNKRKESYYNDGITRISDQLLSNNLPNISQYAVQANMSLRNFERRFTEQIGTSPKLFCRLVRFNAAVQAKCASPEKSWMDIAFENGYYDDMHLIKEFKQFTTASPAAFFENASFMMSEKVYRVAR